MTHLTSVCCFLDIVYAVQLDRGYGICVYIELIRRLYAGKSFVFQLSDCIGAF